MIKRFLYFEGEKYHPQGGSKDLQGSYDTLQEAIKVFEDYLNAILQEMRTYYDDPNTTHEEAFNSYFNDELRWCHIFDLVTEEIVWENGKFVEN